MGSKGVRSIVMVCLLLRILVEESTAFDLQCYSYCCKSCQNDFRTPTYDCAVECMNKCGAAAAASYEITANDYFRSLGCASSLCAKLSSEENPAEDQVHSCVISCSKACSQNYSLSKNNQVVHD